MGCTSSAPVSDIHSHTTENEKAEVNENKNEKTENSVQEDLKREEDQEIVENLECKVIKMLPICDNLEENLQLDRSSNSPPDIFTTEAESEATDLNNVEKNEPEPTAVEETTPTIDTEKPPQKCSTFQEVVDQVVLDSILEDIAKMPGLKENEEDNVDNDHNVYQNDIVNENSDEINHSTNEDKKYKELEEDPEEAASPSQSECSRATRWEALADIAAELPPSLAVDPLTGQIFSLTK
ncbi:hypothetical protein KGM_211647 [Danaus plexippus plexippus]|uniref:Uncharacterized protein n=1 Tax=Danaus plexippus plexippus TaxID=278856 RepID=A0A212FDC1_DANPL|nr:hypothetical protein KGM_211647 [Danaus plexippus plexippus]